MPCDNWFCLKIVNTRTCSAQRTWLLLVSAVVYIFPLSGTSVKIWLTELLLCYSVFFLKKHGILTLMLKTIRGRSRCRNAKVQLITMIVIQFADDLYISFVYLSFF